MDSQVSIQTYTVQPVPTTISPVLPALLPDPAPIDAAFNAGTQQLTVALTFMIPGNLNASQVSIKQYYDSSQSSKLYFYICYNSESTATPKAVSCAFQASATGPGGTPITLGAILNVYIMMYNAAGPKTSRGAMVTVRTTEV